MNLKLRFYLHYSPGFGKLELTRGDVDRHITTHG